MQMIEVTANSVQAAIDKGLAELKARPGEVVVEVLDEPNTGLFGFGAKEARVRLVLIGTRSKDEPEAAEYADGAIEEPRPSPPSPGLSDAELDEDALVAKQVLEDLLERMGVDATVAVQRAEDDDEGEDPHWMLNISGDRVNRLIGRRGETLSSLQHIVRLICSRRLERRANIIVDAGGYKSGRSKRLRGLANRMAKQAVQQGRTITLEPMHPNERRIIHLTLRGRNDVMTQSVGEGRGRKVTIVPR